MPEPQYEKGQASEFSDFRRMSYLANTGITIYLENNGRLEHAQQMAGHESPLTTKLYDRQRTRLPERLATTA